MRILIADSQELFRLGIMNVITMNDTKEIMEAENFYEAKKILINRNIDIILIGLQLKQENGLELISFVKNLNNDIKVIVLSREMNLHDFLSAKGLGVDGYLLKDVRVDDLAYAIKVVIRGDHFYSNQLLELSACQAEPKELSNLTDREKEVFRLLCQGLSNFEIGKSLYISESTAKKHISNILNKLHLSKRVEAIFFADKLYSRYMNSVV